MTIEQVKEEAKKKFDKDLTDEQAQERIDKKLPEEVRTLPETEELSDGELDGVNGGCRTPTASRDGKEDQDGTEAVAGGALSSKNVIAATKLNVSSRDLIRQMKQNRK